MLSASAFGTTIVSGEIDFEDSLTGGVRAGYWFDAVPWIGAAADVSYFAPDEMTATPSSTSFRFRRC